MENLVLPSFKTTSTWQTRFGLIALFFGCVVKLWANLVHYPSLNEIFGIFSISAIFLATLMSLSRTTVINAQQKAATTVTTLLGKPMTSKSLDLSTAAWIRARQTSSKLDTITIEVGTVGYKTTALMMLPDGDGKNISESEQWCERIASVLGIQSKGYKKQW